MSSLEVVSGQEFLLGGSEMSYLGPGLELRRCRVVIDKRSSRSLVITRLKCIDSLVETRRTLVDFSFCSASFEKVHFVGRYHSCDFGSWPEHYDETGGLKESDFSAAALHGCRFMSCDLRTMRLPLWPCFTIVGAKSRIEEMRACGWPKELELVLKTLSYLPDAAVGITFDTREFERRYAFDVAELRECLERVGDVVTEP